MAKKSLLIQLQNLKGKIVTLTFKKNNLSLRCRLNCILKSAISNKWILIIDNGVTQVVPLVEVRGVSAEPFIDHSWRKQQKP
jgi:hypothetical protein